METPKKWSEAVKEVFEPASVSIRTVFCTVGIIVVAVLVIFVEVLLVRFHSALQLKDLTRVELAQNAELIALSGVATGVICCVCIAAIYLVIWKHRIDATSYKRIAHYKKAPEPLEKDVS